MISFFPLAETPDWGTHGGHLCWSVLAARVQHPPHATRLDSSRLAMRANQDCSTCPLEPYHGSRKQTVVGWQAKKGPLLRAQRLLVVDTPFVGSHCLPYGPRCASWTLTNLLPARPSYRSVKRRLP